MKILTNGYTTFYKNVSQNLKKDKMEPTLLADKTRLNEIYKLRVLAWEQSNYCKFINKKMFPYGWTDHLDNDGFHWIIENEKKEIIASARFNILDSTDDLIEEYYSKFQYPVTRPFGYLSRLVIHPEYRNLKLSNKFVTVLINFIRQKNICFSIVGVYSRGVERLKYFGFKEIGKSQFNVYSCNETDEAHVLIYENTNHH